MITAIVRGRSFPVNHAAQRMKPSAGSEGSRLLPGYAYAHNHGMATTTIRSTYALDVDTVRALERMAQRWKVSKSEALRRAIRAAAQENPLPATDALRALDQLQRSLKLTPAKAQAWARNVRAERRAWPARSRENPG